jgi:hypothetical protein
LLFDAVASLFTTSRYRCLEIILRSTVDVVLPTKPRFPCVLFNGAESRLSREERTGYMDEADRFYADPEGFIVQLLSKLPQRLVFFDTLSANLDIIRDKYREVIHTYNIHTIVFGMASDGSVPDFLIPIFMMIGAGEGMLSYGV